MNNGIAESDFDWWVGADRSDQYTLHVTEIGKQQILNNQAIVEALQKDLKETEESFLEAKHDVNRRILDYHSVMVKAVLRETYHSIGSGGKK